MRFHRLPVLTAIVLLGAASAWAVKPQQWVHQTEADFASAEREQVVVTNLGEIELARATTELAQLDGDDAVIYDLARLDDGRVIAAVGPVGKLARLDGEMLLNFAEMPGEQVFALAAVGNDLWVGVSGGAPRLELRRGDDLAVVRQIELGEGLRYVWDLLLIGDRMIVATGGKGSVRSVDIKADDAEAAVILETKQSNVLCLGADDRGRLYAGTDGEGLIFRLTPREVGGYEAFVLYDAAEPEIGSLLVLGDGTVYAGTADAEQAKPGRLSEATGEQRGRLEPPPPDARVPSIPNVPPKPEPKPGEAGAAPDDGASEPRPPGAAAAGPAQTPEIPSDPQPPTAEQYDALRQRVAERLTQARETGRVELQAAPPVRPAGGGAATGGAAARRPGTAAGKRGNAVYRISPQGFVKEVFRESVMILRIVPVRGWLLVATGNEGEIYRVDPATEEVTILADVEPQQVPALLAIGGGGVLAGTANPGRVIRLDDRYAETGTITAAPLDAAQVSLWGKLQVMASIPDGAAVTFQTRSGNVADPEAGSWSDWSPARAIELDAGASDYLDIASPAARFLQYRVALTSEGQASAKVIRVALHYLLPNLQPKIASLKSEYQPTKGREGEPVVLSTLRVQWEAADDNGDALRFKLEAARFGPAGEEPFIAIADDLTAPSYDWDTRTAPDGRYVLRVTATDAADNVADQVLTATRRSDPVLVDNTPPELRDVQVRRGDDGAVITATAADALAPVVDVRYKLDSQDDWRMVLPEDLIYDSTSERVAITIPALAPGLHVVSIRVTDALGNSRYVSQTLAGD